MTPARAAGLLGARRRAIPGASSRAHFGPARRALHCVLANGARFRSCSNSRGRRWARACVALGNAAQTLHPVAGQGFNLGLRDAWELAQIVLDAPRDALGDDAMLAAIRAAGAPIGWRASRSRTDSSVCSATIFRSCAGRAGWRSLCSTRFRRRSARSRARCCSACADSRATFLALQKAVATLSRRRNREDICVDSKSRTRSRRLAAV